MKEHTNDIQKTSEVETLLQGLEFDKQYSVNGTTFVPIIGQVDSFSPGLQIGLRNTDNVKFSELEPATVNFVEVESRFQGAILFLAGIILLGGMQTRAPKRPFIITHGSKHVIPVNCIEQGRWRYSSNPAFGEDRSRFRSKDQMVSRKTKSTLNNNYSSQSDTWDSIDALRAFRGPSSIPLRRQNFAPTSSYIDIEMAIKSDKKDRVKSLREDLGSVFLHDHQRGIAIFDNGKLSDIEVFINSEYWDTVKYQFLEANITDIMISKNTENQNTVEELRMNNITLEKDIAIGDELSYSVRMDRKSGHAIEHEGKIVYFNLTSLH